MVSLISVVYSSVDYFLVVSATTVVVAESAAQAAVESQQTAVESVVVAFSVASVFPLQEAKKIVADAKSIKAIFFIIVSFFVFFCFVYRILYIKN